MEEQKRRVPLARAFQKAVLYGGVIGFVGIMSGLSFSTLGAVSFLVGYVALVVSHGYEKEIQALQAQKTQTALLPAPPAP